MTTTAVSAWAIDPIHSTVEFSLRYLGITTFKGRFRNLTGTIQADESNPASASVDASIDVTSLDTLIAPFTERMLSDDFFAATTYPAITFHSTGVELIDATHALVRGDLAIRGVTRPVVLETAYNGQAVNPLDGRLNAAFTATTTLDRSAFGLTSNVVLDSGAQAIGERVRLVLDIHTVRAE